MNEEASYKTVLVLDHGPFFANSCGEAIDIEAKTKQAEGVSVSKSLWTCNVEVALEYLRIVTDLFPESRFLRFVVSDFVGRFVTAAWSHKLQLLEHVLDSLGQIGAPDASSDPDACVILNGLSLAVEGLTQVTDVQKANKKAGTTVRNCGRIVVFTHLKHNNLIYVYEYIKNRDEEIETVESHLLEEIESRNRLAQNLDDNFLPLDYVELCVLNIFPVGEKPGPSLNNRDLRKVSEHMWSEFRNSASGKVLASCLQCLALKHYNLTSTTVTGIPMKDAPTSLRDVTQPGPNAFICRRLHISVAHPNQTAMSNFSTREEQTSGSSVNYDVDLLHESRGHDELSRAHYLDKEMGLVIPAANTSCREYDTLMLKWCSPNVKPMISAEHFHMTTCAVRVSPAAVNSRPSACLTSFILSGRTVMLEIPKKTSGGSSSKLISHLLRDVSFKY